MSRRAAQRLSLLASCRRRALQPPSLLREAPLVSLAIPRRSFASINPPRAASSGKGIPVTYVFTGLISVGLLITIYSVLEYVYALQTWPEPIRTPLKNAIKARNQGDPEKAEVWFRKAIVAARSIPLAGLEPNPLLKLSGIYITFASLLESAGKPLEAYIELRTALQLFGGDPLAGTGDPTSQSDHVRAVGLAQKIGQLALQIGGMSLVLPYPRTEGEGVKTWDEAAEKYLSSALTAMLRLGLSDRPKGDVVVVGRDVDLPESSLEGDGGKVDKRGIGMTMESLAEVYARKGQYDLAGQLLIQAVSTLLPPKSEQVPSVSDRCQAALLMTTISSHASQPRTPKSIKAAKSWSLRSLQIADQALNDSPEDAASTICKRSRSVALYNMGMLAEMEGELGEALRQFSQALESSRENGFLEGRRQALDAIRRVRSLGGK